MNKMAQQISNTFCILPWTHFNVSPSGYTSLCCYNQSFNYEIPVDEPYIDSRSDCHGGYIDEGVENVWNNPYFKNARKAMMAGKKVTDHLPKSLCEKCYAEERGGMQSDRQFFNNRYSKEQIDALIEKTRPDGYLDTLPVDFRIFVGSTCNLQCIMCGPDLSSALISVHKKIATMEGWVDKLSPQLVFNKNSKDPYKNPLVWKEILDPVLKNIHTLQILGGEPLVLKAHYDLLKYCIDKGYNENISLILNTNGTKIPSNELVEMWSKFKEVRIHLSLDAIEERNEYIRYPSKWNDILKFIEFVENMALDNIEANIMPTVQVINIYYIPELFDWIADQQFSVWNSGKFSSGKSTSDINSFPNQFRTNRFYINILEEMRKNNVKSLSPEAKKIVDQKCSPWYNKINQLRGIIKFMHSEDWYNDQYHLFTNWHTKLDMIRGTDFYKTFPIFKEFDK